MDRPGARNLAAALIETAFRQRRDDFVLRCLFLLGERVFQIRGCGVKLAGEKASVAFGFAGGLEMRLDSAGVRAAGVGRDRDQNAVRAREGREDQVQAGRQRILPAELRAGNGEPYGRGGKRAGGVGRICEARSCEVVGAHGERYSVVAQRQE